MAVTFSATGGYDMQGYFSDLAENGCVDKFNIDNFQYLKLIVISYHNMVLKSLIISGINISKFG